MKNPTNVKRGKTSRAAGLRFELKVRHDLEKQGWIVSKWQNNVEFDREYIGKINYEGRGPISTIKIAGKLIPAKHKFNFFTKAMTIGNGFPDFICIRKDEKINWCVQLVESKMNGVLSKEEKEKIEWLKSNLHIPIFKAMKGEKRGEIIYEVC